jgi:hypothetical protein
MVSLSLDWRLSSMLHGRPPVPALDPPGVIARGVPHANGLRSIRTGKREAVVCVYVEVPGAAASGGPAVLFLTARRIAGCETPHCATLRAPS